MKLIPFEMALSESNGTVKKVTKYGIPISKHFIACRTKSNEWRITHLQTGRALIHASFITRRDAQKFAQGFEVLFGDILNSDDDYKIKIAVNNNEKTAFACKLIIEMEKHPANPYSIDDVKALAKRLRNGNSG